MRSYGTPLDRERTWWGWRESRGSGMEWWSLRKVLGIVVKRIAWLSNKLREWRLWWSAWWGWLIWNVRRWRWIRIHRTWRWRRHLWEREGKQSILIELRNSRNSMTEGMWWGWLSHVTDAHNPRVNLERTDILQEEAMETWWNEIKCVWIFVGCLKISYELKCFIVKRQCSRRGNELIEKKEEEKQLIIYCVTRSRVNWVVKLWDCPENLERTNNHHKNSSPNVCHFRSRVEARPILHLLLFIRFRIELCDCRFRKGSEENISTIRTRP